MPTLDDALQYARAGIPVFPLAGKRPIEQPGQPNVDGLVIPQGQGGFKQATTDEGKIARWWTQYPSANIGTPTGKHIDAMTGLPNALRFDVLDIDTGHGGERSLEQLIAANAALPQTVMQRTGSGGYHYCFLSDGKVKNSAGGIAPGIDVRGTGGYIVIAPSVHPGTGQPYRWQAGQELGSYQLAEWPAWLLERIQETDRKRQSPTPGERIPLGMQEATLMRVAGAMRRHGATEEEIYAAIKIIGQERCDPPVAEKDLRRMAASASNYEPGIALLDYPLDDAGNAERLVTRYGHRLRHTEDARGGSDGWYYFTGTVWEQSTSKVVQDQLETARAYADAIDQLPDDDEHAPIKRAHKANAKGMASERGMTSIRKVTATFPEIAIHRHELDSDPWLFSCANGVIDLKTGELREHRAPDLITRASPVAYDPDARSELWENYLKWLTKGRADLELFLQRAVGYTLTGDTREEKLFFIHGPAASGKTTLIEALNTVLGGYSLTADFTTFLKGHAVGGPRQDIARMQGTRYVHSVEVDQGKALAEGLVKQMTGGDTVTARFLYGTEFEYQPTHKLWLVANDAPKVNSEDDGLWRRILRIPCDNVVPEGERDSSIKARLKDASIGGPAILAWAIEGALGWQSDGLAIPESIRAATREYKESQDPITDFVAEVCEVGEGMRVAFGDLWHAYLMYCKTYRRKPMGKLVFGDRLEAKGYKRGRTGSGRFIDGLAIATSEYTE